MQSYTELVAPTAVKHAICLPFTSASAINLIVVKTSLLQVFALKTFISTTAQNQGAINGQKVNGDQESSHASSDRISTTKLVWVAEYQLAGSVSGLARVKLPDTKSGGFALLVALRDAKLSLVEWDTEKFCISNISIHYYEKREGLLSPLEPELSELTTILTVDPQYRCAVLKFGLHHIAILPFRQAGEDTMMGYLDTNGQPQHTETTQSNSGKAGDANTPGPCHASVVISLTALDPNLTHPIHLTFLLEYREPTFGVLFSQKAPSSALIHERRDVISYNVYNLDLEQKASTTLLSISNLPSDLFSVISMTRAIGGALLVGTNEIIHVDQAGRTNGVAVNKTAKIGTSFALIDQSDLDLKLEGCKIQQLGPENPELLLIQSDGSINYITFKIDGRSVSGLKIRAEDAKANPLRFPAAPSAVAIFPRGRLMFLGSDDNDAVLLGWSRRGDNAKTPQGSNLADSSAQELMKEDLDAFDLDDDDDLYRDETDNQLGLDTPATGKDSHENQYFWRLHDTMINIGPMTDVTFARRQSGSMDGKECQEIIGICGSGRNGALVSLSQNIHPEPIHDHQIDDAQNIWAFQISAQTDRNPAGYRHLVFINIEDSQNPGFTQAYAVDDDDKLSAITDKDFDAQAGISVAVGTLNHDTKIVQVLGTEVRAYETDLSLAQIYSLANDDLMDDENQSSTEVKHSSFADPFVLLIQSDRTIALLRIDESGDLDAISQTESFRSRKWIAGCLYEDANDELRLDFAEDVDVELENVLAFLIDENGGLYIYRLPALDAPVYVAEGLSYVPPFLTSDFSVRRSNAKEPICDIVVAELGDQLSKTLTMLLRTNEDNLYLYQPYQAPIRGSKETTLQFIKLPVDSLPPGSTGDSRDLEDRALRGPMRILPNINGYSTVWVPGAPSHLVLKSTSSRPYVIPLALGEVKDICSFQCQSSAATPGFLFLTEEEKVCSSSLRMQTTYETGLASEKSKLDCEINALAYHEHRNLFVISSVTSCPFHLSESDMGHGQDWDIEDSSISPAALPSMDKSELHLFDPQSESIIHTTQFESNELITAISCLSLCTSEHTLEREDLVCVGTAMLKGEDLAAMGHVYIYRVVSIVPEPDRPETCWGLKLVAKDEVKGAVTALSAVGTQGFLMHTQGQKTLVKGLKEDGSLLPVAFMDMQCHVTAASELSQSGLCVMADALKGLWFTGYTEDPYQLRLMSKTPFPLEAMTAGLLPDGEKLFIVATDADGNLCLFQFDPDHPRTLSGNKLLSFVPFSTPNFPAAIRAFPPHHAHYGSLLLVSRNGSLALLKALPESTHRTLTYLQSHLSGTLTQPLGLNPRSFRAPKGRVGRIIEQQGLGAEIGSRTIIDVNVLKRWEEAGSWKRWGGEDKEEVRRCVRIAAGRKAWGFAGRPEWGEIED